MVVNARLTRAALAAAVSLAILPGPALAGGPHPDSTFRPGSAGAGDPYFPLDGNGGYDVTHYDLDLRFDPATDHLDAVATITARATQNLSAFDLDFAGLTVRGVKVDGRSADWRRDDQELVIVPRRGLPKGNVFITRIDYDGTPGPTDDGFGGWFNTEDGASVAGEPHGAATWFPVNDHPSDKASYAIHVTAPKDLEVASNGTLKDRRTTGAWTTWTWVEDAPMAAYLATVTIGQFGVHAYRADGIRFWDFTPDRLAVPLPTPHGGSRYAISQVGMPSYKRLTRSIAVPPGGANLSFWVAGQTEFPWDFGVVEAHTAGSDADWTTLRDLNGHNAADTGASCPYWLPIHPFLEHYETDNGDDTCAPSGTTGDWWGETGQRDGWEQWDVDLSPWAGKTAEVSITYASDDLVQREGLFVDDIVSSTGVGSTGFEADGDVMDGWTVSGAPAGSEPNPNDWIVGTAADAPPTIADLIAESFSHQPAILAFESRTFGSYPFTTGGGIVVNTDDIGFALETQTRPTYALHYWTDREVSDDVLVHELAHQWFGDTVSVGRWQDIWLNEGFASYAQWLWSEDQGSDSAQDIFDFFYDVHPADDPFWTLVVADPGPAQLFDRPVYVRGAMTLHQLRLDVGDDAFFRILRQWVKTRGGGSGTTPQFIALAERISGHDLDALFQTWLFTPTKPVVGSLMTSLAGRAADLRHAPSPAVDGIERFGVGTRAASPRR